ncbi:MAG TPA: tyrosine-type recombinase/integrase [Aggregatilinea sp.]|uniref:tyrosine-type recombinase/integrase n=1 Tax=Aggregatilinea sp. TaxID=2806333 RepID=UPI002B863DFD|nr:tyrosine-type recombinase/integrase [Aggregatilinea sp.]HML22118.1 tyrosine-type recombinase/integrase [Aggregatilinea sp.]
MSAPTLEAAIHRHLNHFSNPATRTHVAYIMRSVLDELGASTPLDEITTDDLDRWNDRLVACEYAASTLATRRRHVKSFFNWCVKREWIERSPARFVEIHEPHQGLTNRAMPEEVLADILLAARRHPYQFLAVRNTAILALLATYGARVGDVTRLTLDRVRWDRHILVFRVKGGKDVELPLLPEVDRVLRVWWDMRASLTPAPTHDRLFVSTQRRGDERYPPLTTAAIQMLVVRLSKEVCGVEYRPHSIRHWRGRSLADDGIAPAVIQHILGHSDVETTMRFYVNQDLDRVTRALEQHLPPAPEEPQKPKIIPFRRKSIV